MKRDEFNNRVEESGGSDRRSSQGRDVGRRKRQAGERNDMTGVLAAGRVQEKEWGDRAGDVANIRGGRQER